MFMLPALRTPCARQRRRHRHVRPELQVLEDRVVPTNFFKWNGSEDTKWSNPNNWDDVIGLGNVAPTGNGDDILEFSSNGRKTSVNNLGANRRFVSITIDGQGYNITPASSFDTIEIVSGGELVLTVTSAAGANNQFDVPVIANGALEVDVQSNAGLILSGAVSGSGRLVKRQAGTLDLRGANSYGGTTDIEAGTVRKGIDAAVIPDSSTVTVSSGATLDLNSFHEGVGGLAGGGAVSIGTATLSVGFNNLPATFNGTISGNPFIGQRWTGSVHKWGSSSWALGGTIAANDLHLFNGTMTLDAADRLDDKIAVAMDNAAVLDMFASERIGSLAGGGSIFLHAGVRLFAGGNNSDTSFNGIIDAGGALTGGFSKEGTGTMTLTGGAQNSRDGFRIENGTLKLDASNIINDGNSVIMNLGTVFDMTNVNEAIGSLHGAGEVKLGTGSLNVGGNNSDSDYSGVISGVGGAVAKNGIGVMTLSGANTFTRGMHINGGTLRLAADNVLHDSVPVGPLANATFDLQNHSDVIGSLSNAGTVLIHNAHLLAGADGSDTTFSGTMRGVGGIFSKLGVGTMTVTGELDVGAIGIDAGVLKLGASNVISDSTLLNSLPDGTFDLNGFGDVIGPLVGEGVINVRHGAVRVRTSGADPTFSGAIVGTGIFNKSGPGTLTLSGNSPQFTGTIGVDGGTLLITGSLPAQIAVGNDAVLGGTGTIGLVTIHDATLAPGTSPGILNTGEVTLTSTSRFQVGLDGFGPGVGYDQLKVSGMVVLSSGELALTTGFIPAPGIRFTIIDNDGTDAISGTFNGLPEGSIVRASPSLFPFRISYQGGDGNDVVLSPITQFIVTGPDAGARPRVKVWNAFDQSPSFSFLAYPASFKGGVRVASADLNNDGLPEIITAPGPGITVLVKGFDRQLGFVRTIKPYGNFKGGAFVTTGDVGGDGVPDIIVGPGKGIAPTIKIFDGATGAPIGSFNAFPASFKGGVTVAAGDVDGDGDLDIVAGSGPGGKPRVRVFDAATRTQLAGAIGSFNAFPGSFKGGVYVAVADVTAELGQNAAAEIIVGPGPGIKPTVKVFTPTTIAAPRSFAAYPGSQKRGVRVGAVDIDGDGKAEILTALGPQGKAEVRIFGGFSLAAVDSFFAESARFTRGLFVAGSH